MISPQYLSKPVSICVLLSAFSLLGQSIRQFRLDEYTIHTIRTQFNKGVTTVMFPSKISGIYGANVVSSSDKIIYDDRGKLKADFLLTYVPGSYYFSIRALRKKATGSLNIIYRRNTYVLKLEESDKPYGSVTFYASHSSNNRAKAVTPSILLSLLDKAKDFRLFKKYYPENVEAIEYCCPNDKTTYPDFEVRIDEAFRFDAYDTLVFRIKLRNLTQNEITYDPRMIAVRLGPVIYYSSLTDASGIIPPQAEVPAYFAITGTPTGGRNNLAAKNNWSVLISTDSPEPVKTESEKLCSLPEK